MKQWTRIQAEWHGFVHFTLSRHVLIDSDISQIHDHFAVIFENWICIFSFPAQDRWTSKTSPLVCESVRSENVNKFDSLVSSTVFDTLYLQSPCPILPKSAASVILLNSEAASSKRLLSVSVLYLGLTWGSNFNICLESTNAVKLKGNQYNHILTHLPFSRSFSIVEIGSS